MSAPLYPSTTAAAATVAAQSGRIIVVFRNDDPSAISDVEHERRLYGMFERYGVPQTIGVIPNVALGPHRDPDARGERRLDTHPEMVNLLRRHCEATGSEIALHGFTHRTSKLSIPARKEYFEFRDEGLCAQADMLSRGLDIVEKSLSVRPATFIPPWNRMDRDTVTACERTGLSIVSASAYAPIGGGVASLGTDCDLFSFPGLFEAALGSDQRVHVFLRILFHSCTTRTNEELAALERALQLATSPQCRVMTIAQAVREYPLEVATVNEAGRNVVAQDMLHGSNRASAILCRRVARTLKRRDSVGELLDESQQLYRSGRYWESAEIGTKIDRAAFSVVMRWFAALACLGLFVGLAANAVLWLSGEFSQLPVWAAIVSATVVITELLRWRATAPDMRRMLRTSGWTFLLGLNAAFLAVELFS